MCLEARQQQQGHGDDHAIGSPIIRPVAPGLVKYRELMRGVRFALRQRKTLRRNAQRRIETRAAVA
jgi:hypothetical protein